MDASCWPDRVGARYRTESISYSVYAPCGLDTVADGTWLGRMMRAEWPYVVTSQVGRMATHGVGAMVALTRGRSMSCEDDRSNRVSGIEHRGLNSHGLALRGGGYFPRGDVRFHQADPDRQAPTRSGDGIRMRNLGVEEIRGYSLPDSIHTMVPLREDGGDSGSREAFKWCFPNLVCIHHWSAQEEGKKKKKQDTRSTAADRAAWSTWTAVQGIQPNYPTGGGIRVANVTGLEVFDESGVAVCRGQRSVHQPMSLTMQGLAEGKCRKDLLAPSLIVGSGHFFPRVGANSSESFDSSPGRECQIHGPVEPRGNSSDGLDRGDALSTGKIEDSVLHPLAPQ
ncbi:hypothetical protein R1flu_001742 [Riccia fluitans]|uniref:Uncharacterized protein n=1 Tax=Riccia fluitans TaxID=41844 RepID=A0ABD1Y466_9MARC